MKTIKRADLELSVNNETGSVTLSLSGNTILNEIESTVDLASGESVGSSDFADHLVSTEEFQDDFEKGVQVSVHHQSNKTDLTMTQIFRLYDNQVVTLQVILKSSELIKTNRIEVMKAAKDSIITGKKKEELRFLTVPFDNDKWAKFVDYPLINAPMSYEFTTIYANNQQAGLVVGSVDHDNWKTGIVGSPLSVIAGVATELTRDLNGVPHGSLSGEEICSPRIFMGVYPDYQEGFAAYGKLNSLIKPALEWQGDVPVGWNSWAALMGTLTYKKYQEASDYIATQQPSFSTMSGKQYVNFDAGWNNFTNKMQDVEAYTEGNNQIPGSYLAPFIGIAPFKGEVAALDGDYEYKELLLKDHEGNILPPIDGLYSFDPTHPGTLAQLKYDIERKKKWGFKFLKVDFLGHACREGAFYNPAITTGIQAYNYGMQYLLECLGDSQIFLSLSIDPIFPHGYGHARRISCDAFGSIDQSEYVNNSTTYLWWMSEQLYRFNDPDHLVIHKSSDMNSISFEEGRTRFNSGVICGGLMIDSDDFSYREARERGDILFSNDEINAIIRQGKTFRPLPSYSGEAAADMFIRETDDGWLLAIFNYNLSDSKSFELDLQKLLGGRVPKYIVRDIWAQTEEAKEANFEITLARCESKILRIKEVNT